jgi:hypothetical protein
LKNPPDWFPDMHAPMTRVHRLRPFHQLRVTADLPRNAPMNRQLCGVSITSDSLTFVLMSRRSST